MRFTDIKLHAIYRYMTKILGHETTIEADLHGLDPEVLDDLKFEILDSINSIEDTVFHGQVKSEDVKKRNGDVITSVSNMLVIIANAGVIITVYPIDFGYSKSTNKSMAKLMMKEHGSLDRKLIKLENSPELQNAYQTRARINADIQDSRSRIKLLESELSLVNAEIDNLLTNKQYIEESKKHIAQRLSSSSH